LVGPKRQRGDGEMQLLLYLSEEEQHHGCATLQIPPQEIRH
jgi:hypothetical protein